MRRFRRSTVFMVSVFLLCLSFVLYKAPVKAGTQHLLENGWDKIQKQLLCLLDFHFPAASLAREYEDIEGEEELLKEQEEYAMSMENAKAEEESETEKKESETEKIKKVKEKKEDSLSVSDNLKEDEKGRMILTKQIFFVDSLTCYTWKQLKNYEYMVENVYQVNSSTTITKKQLDADSLLHKDLTIDKSKDEPQILIYHTHATEYFKDSDKSNPSTLIPGVGEYLAKLLEEDYGYQVIHDTTVFPYNQAYSKGREKAEQILEKYPSIKVVIDMHRDSANGRHYVTKINGKDTATIMFFNGMSQTKDGVIDSRDNPNLETNLAFSLQLKVAGDELFKGFVRRNYLKAYRYNMHLMGRYSLVEVGAETNTLKEAKNAMEPLAAMINQVLQ